MHACIQTYRHTDIQTCRHTDIQTYRHTDIQTDRQTYRHTNIQTYRHTDIQTYRHTDIHTYIHTNSPTITPPSLSYFLFPGCFSVLSLSLEKLLACGVIRSYNLYIYINLYHVFPYYPPCTPLDPSNLEFRFLHLGRGIRTWILARNHRWETWENRDMGGTFMGMNMSINVKNKNMTNRTISWDISETFMVITGENYTTLIDIPGMLTVYLCNINGISVY